MNSDYENIKAILDGTGGPEVYSFGDTRYNLVWKILKNLGCDPAFGDTEYELWRKILECEHPGEYVFGDTVQQILAKLDGGSANRSPSEILEDLAQSGLESPPVNEDAFTLIGSSSPFTLIGSSEPFELIS